MTSLKRVFVLRRVLPSGVELDTILDEYYSLILKDKSIKEFNSHIALWSEDDLVGVYGIVCVDDIDLIMPLYEDSAYYIMTSEGQTFSNISNK